MGNEKKGIRNGEWENGSKKWEISYDEDDLRNKKWGMRNKE